MLILGAGSQGKVVADIIAAAGEHRIHGFLEIGKDPARVGGEILGLPVLGTVDDIVRVITSCRAKTAAVAIGDNRERERLFTLARKAGLELPVIIHPSAVVSVHAQLGAGTVVAAHAYVGVDANIGEGCIINTSASVDHDCLLGRFVHVAVGARLPGTVKAGDYVTFGAGSTCVPGVTVGCGATIGAGAAVVGDVAADATVVGVPAKAVKKA